MLGSSGYGTKFAAVNGMSAVFAHHMSPEIAVDSLVAYRQEFAPREPVGRVFEFGLLAPAPAPAKLAAQAAATGRT